MLKIRSLGQPANEPRRDDVDWRGVFAAGAFLAVAYFFIVAPETPEWARTKRNL